MIWNNRRMQDLNRGKLPSLTVLNAIMLSWASAVKTANPFWRIGAIALVRTIMVCVVYCYIMISPLSAAIDVTRMWFTPPVVPENYAQQVRFEATVAGNPASVAFEYDGVDRTMYDNGTNGDRVAGDGTWTILFQPNEIISKLTAAWVYRPFIGFCKPQGGGRYNIFAEVWTSAIGSVAVQSMDAGAQQTEHLVNLKVTADQLMNFTPAVWAQRFYSMYGDNFDFLNFVLVAGKRGNRYHQNITNDISGIGLPIFNNSASYGSGGRLKSYNMFPLSNFFDTASTGFNHETGHQWINFLQNTPFASGIAHWPKGDIAINVMGFSIPTTGAGGVYGYTFTSNGQGGYVVGPADSLNLNLFNSMELYLMGLVPPSAVGTFFVLNDQNQSIFPGQTLQPSEITLATVNDVIGAAGTRNPDSTASQKAFRVATIILSEDLLDGYAMSFYDWFARRAGERQQLTCSEGFQNGYACNPFYLATGGRGRMITGLKSNGELIDLDSDGKPDILWRNTSTGDNYVWYLDGVTVLGGGNLPTVADQNWKAVGVADFNNDSKPDVLWRNVSTGDNYVWYLDGVTVLAGGNLPMVADQNLEGRRRSGLQR